MQVKDIMTQNVISVTKDESISAVAKVLQRYRIHGVPVVEGNCLIGIITETDFFTKGELEIHLPSYVDFLNKTGLADDKKEAKLGEFEKILKAKAEDIMTAKCITLSPESDLGEFLKIVKKRNIHTLPVVTEGNILVGIATVADVIKFI